MKNSTTSLRILKLGGSLFLLAIWELAAHLLDEHLLLPGPVATLAHAVEMMLAPGFLTTLGSTILRGLIGFAIALFLAFFLGLWAGLSARFHAFFSPLLITLRSVPVVSFILLALIWFSVDAVPVFIAILTMFPMMCMSIIDGIHYADEELTTMARVYEVPQNRIIREVYLPSLTPFLFTGMSNAMGFGWRAIIIGEVLSQPQWGIGSAMHTAQTFLMVKEVIAWTLIAVMVSFLFERLIRTLQKSTMTWR
ncbi:MAG: ABC transporter permease [Bacteroidota bacterium]